MRSRKRSRSRARLEPWSEIAVFGVALTAGLLVLARLEHGSWQLGINAQIAASGITGVVIVRLVRGRRARQRR